MRDPRFGADSEGLVVQGDHKRWATLSTDGKYRYVLARLWDDYIIDTSLPWMDQPQPGRPLMTWIMLNPSTADHTVDDPTIRKCVGFARRHGCGGIVVANLFALRSTDPKGLTTSADPIGPRNLDAISWALNCYLLQLGVAGWGRFPSKRIERLAVRSASQAKCARKLHAFGVTAGGEPRHPLMLAYDTPLRGPGEWRVPWARGVVP